jgi:hypothetical protein
MAGDLWPAVVTLKDPAASLLSAKLEVLHKATLAACDKLDGVEDGLLGKSGALSLRSGHGAVQG